MCWKTGMALTFALAFAPAVVAAQQPGSWAETSILPDDMLEDVIVIRLAERSNLSRLIEVKVRDRIVTLSGKVPTQKAKQRALRIAKTTRGVLSVRDQIQIESSTARTSKPRDAKVEERQLARRVAENIASSIEGTKAGKDWWFDGWRVEGPYNRWNLVVDVDEPGLVVLEGEAPNLGIKRKAVEAAAQSPGVTRLDISIGLQGYAGGYYPYAYYPYGHVPYYSYVPTPQGDMWSWHRPATELPAGSP